MHEFPAHCALHAIPPDPGPVPAAGTPGMNPPASRPGPGAARARRFDPRIAALGIAVAAGLGLAASLWSMLPATPAQAEPAAAQATTSSAAALKSLPDEGKAPALDGAVAWLNSAPLTGSALHGKVVLVDFWTYTCINCLRALPHVKAWAEHYRDRGLVVVGVHTPEFDFEKELPNVRRALGELGITYPVAVDSNYRIWRAFDNHYWPAHYFIDARGHIRHHHFGEGEYGASEKIIRDLLGEAGHPVDDLPYAPVSASGVQLAPDMARIGSPETYLGYVRAQRFASRGGIVADRSHSYEAPTQPALNRWGLGGHWSVHEEQATLDQPGGSIVYRFSARDLNLVLGPGKDAKPIRFSVLLDGQRPGADHGGDIDAQGDGTIIHQRLYQLIRSSEGAREHSFEIRFHDAGVQAFAFTFG